ncbi:hypothetical protein [Tepidimonas sp.]|uniref:hypothetical protein n=1 Tax=Tepidimonas sp. TaxID=2002775 RepID=UPI00391DBB31
MEHQEQQQTRLTREQVGVMVDRFFDAVEDRDKPGRAWTWDRLNHRADMPGSARIQAVLLPDDETGFALHARQDGTVHPITHNGARVRFRTIEQALTALVDVSGLHPEIVINAGNWQASTGPV